MVRFVRVCLEVYAKPRAAFSRLRRSPAPVWGLYGVVGRSLMLSLLFYLPLVLSGHTSPVPSYISFIPTEQVYLILIFFTPVFFSFEWLMFGAFVHLVLRLAGHRDDVDVILNVIGVTWFVIQPVLLVLDWITLAAGANVPAFVGVIHLTVAIVWGTVLTVVAYRETLDTPYRLSIVLSVACSIIYLPLGILFMKPL